MASFMYSTTINNNHNNYDILFSYFDGKSAIEVQVWVPCAVGQALLPASAKWAPEIFLWQ